MGIEEKERDEVVRSHACNKYERIMANRTGRKETEGRGLKKN
jgi:hypothetical protein